MKHDVIIVLVEPQSAGNVGMVCRAMKNMGLSQLRIVKGCSLADPEAAKFAVSAKDLLENVVRYDTLAEALGDVEISVATTRRFGKYRQEILTPMEVYKKLAAYPQRLKAAIVFGREDHGLSTEELSLCRWHATIPTAGEYGSLNLAQAVLIFCYEFCKSLETPDGRSERHPAQGAEMEEMFAQMEQTLLRIGFLNPQNPDHLMRALRRIFFRADLDSREVAVMRGMMSQIEWAAESFKGKKKSL